jgi:intracellular multiplication protein IcmQ
LRDIRDGLQNYIELRKQEQRNLSSYVSNREKLRADQQEVYVSLYSTEGRLIQSWERIVNNLPRQIISRPIYENEEDIITAIKYKENKENEAYVSVYINTSDVLTIHEDKIPKDKLGKKLLVLKDKALELDNITRFVHLSGEYQYLHGRLIKNKP